MEKEDHRKRPPLVTTYDSGKGLGENAEYSLQERKYGAPGAIRTPGLRLRRPSLYPLSYRRAWDLSTEILYHIL